MLHSSAISFTAVLAEFRTGAAFFPRQPVTFTLPPEHSSYFSPHADVGIANPKNMTYEILMTLTWDKTLPVGSARGAKFIQEQADKRKTQVISIGGHSVVTEEGTRKNGMRIYHYFVALDRGFVHISWTDAKTPNETREPIIKDIIASLKEPKETEGNEP